MYLRIGKFLLVIAASAMVVVLAACASLEEKEQASGEASPGLRDVLQSKLVITHSRMALQSLKSWVQKRVQKRLLCLFIRRPMESKSC
jgi:hypothetical protein